MCGERIQRFRAAILRLAGVGLLAAPLLPGCTSAEKMRGDGFSDAENWGQELRNQRSNNSAGFGGLTTKAHQIEQNLGVQ